MGYIIRNGAYLVFNAGDQEWQTLNNITHSSLFQNQKNQHRVWENSITQNIHEDNITQLSVTQHEAAINHDALSNTHNLTTDIDHLTISNVGTNTHAQIDTHIADGTLHFTEGSIDHANIQNIGTNTHAQIDTHISDSTVHFTESSIDHTNITNVGTNTHAQIDTHIALTDEHFPTTVVSGDANHVALVNAGETALVADQTAKFKLTSNDQLLLGLDTTAIPVNESFAETEMKVHFVQDATYDAAGYTRFSNDASGPRFVLTKYRGTEASPAIAQASDVLGEIVFGGYLGVPSIVEYAAAARVVGVMNESTGALNGKTGLEFYTGNGASQNLICEMKEDSTAFGRTTQFYGGFIVDNFQFTGYFQENIYSYDTTTAASIPIGDRSLAHNNNSSSTLIGSTHTGAFDLALNTGHQLVFFEYSSAPDVNVDITSTGYTSGVAEVNGHTGSAKGIYLNEPYQTAVITKLTNVTDDTVDRYHISKTAGIHEAVTLTSGTHTVDNSMMLILCDCSSGNITLNLPTSARRDSREFIIKKIDGTANTVTVNRAGSDTIDGATSFTLTTQYQGHGIMGDGVTGWHIVRTF